MVDKATKCHVLKPLPVVNKKHRTRETKKKPQRQRYLLSVTELVRLFASLLLLWGRLCESVLCYTLLRCHCSDKTLKQESDLIGPHKQTRKRPTSSVHGCAQTVGRTHTCDDVKPPPRTHEHTHTHI